MIRQSSTQSTECKRLESGNLTIDSLILKPQLIHTSWSMIAARDVAEKDLSPVLKIGLSVMRLLYDQCNERGSRKFNRRYKALSISALDSTGNTDAQTPLQKSEAERRQKTRHKRALRKDPAFRATFHIPKFWL